MFAVGSHFGYQILRPVVDYVTTVRQMMHFLLRCEAFKEMRKNNFIKFNSKITNFNDLNDIEKFKILLGEGDHAYLASLYILACHTLRDSE